MATTPLSAVKEIHQNDETISQYISQGVWYAVAPDQIDITAGGLLVLEHRGTVREKTTESVMERTKINLLYFYSDLNLLDEIIVPWAVAAFDDAEDQTKGPVLSINGCNIVSVDIAEDDPIIMGLEAYRDKNGNNVYSATVPLAILTEKPRQEAYADA